VLCTHFGLSGPGVLDISRYYIDSKMSDPGAALVVNWLPGETFESTDRALVELGSASVGRWAREWLPERLVDAVCGSAGVEMGLAGNALTKEARRALARALVEMRVPVSGDRGFTYAEVTAGGVPLSELHLESMESRICPGLHLCGEICDVDGRIGGYNFQWAWSSGYTAGVSVE
jgi:predicted Rossmann fold flavoprotein